MNNRPKIRRAQLAPILISMIADNNGPVVEAVIYAGADVNATFGDDQVTPLAFAIKKNAFECAALLLENKADGRYTTGENNPWVAALEKPLFLTLLMRKGLTIKWPDLLRVKPEAFDKISTIIDGKMTELVDSFKNPGLNMDELINTFNQYMRCIRGSDKFLKDKRAALRKTFVSKVGELVAALNNDSDLSFFRARLETMINGLHLITGGVLKKQSKKDLEGYLHQVDVKIKQQSTHVVEAIKDDEVGNVNFVLDDEWVDVSASLALNNTLFEAIKNRDVAGVKAAIDAGANPNGLNEFHQPLLYIAILYKLGQETYEYLLSKGAEDNIQIKIGDRNISLLACAMMVNNLPAVVLLMDRKAKAGSLQYDEALWVMASENTVMLRMLMDAGFRLDWSLFSTHPYDTDVCTNIASLISEQLKVLWHELLNPAFDARRAIDLLNYDTHYYISSDKNPLLKEARLALGSALVQGVSSELNKLTIDSNLALFKKRVEMMRGLDLIKNRGLVRSPAMKALDDLMPALNEKIKEKHDHFMGLLTSGTLEAVRAAIEAGAEINERYHSSLTPLGRVIEGCRLDILNLLIEMKVDVNGDIDAHGTTPLVAAAYNKERESVAALIKAGATIVLEAVDPVFYPRVRAVLFSVSLDLMRENKNNVHFINQLSQYFLYEREFEQCKALAMGEAKPLSAPEVAPVPVLSVSQDESLELKPKASESSQKTPRQLSWLTLFGKEAAKKFKKSSPFDDIYQQKVFGEDEETRSRLDQSL